MVTAFTGMLICMCVCERNLFHRGISQWREHQHGHRRHRSPCYHHQLHRVIPQGAHNLEPNTDNTFQLGRPCLTSYLTNVCFCVWKTDLYVNAWSEYNHATLSDWSFFDWTSACDLFPTTLQGLTNYNNVSAVINESVFDPSQITEHRMLYFWISGQFSCFVFGSNRLMLDLLEPDG